MSFFGRLVTENCFLKKTLYSEHGIICTYHNWISGSLRQSNSTDKKHCQRHHQGNLKFIMRFYRLESDNLRVTLAAIIERFHTRHGNRRTTLSDTTDTPTTVLTPRKGYYISTRLSDETLEGIRTYIFQ